MGEKINTVTDIQNLLPGRIKQPHTFRRVSKYLLDDKKVNCRHCFYRPKVTWFNFVNSQTKRDKWIAFKQYAPFIKTQQLKSQKNHGWENSTILRRLRSGKDTFLPGQFSGYHTSLSPMWLTFYHFCQYVKMV